MGSLITETPYSEITATLEVLDCLGVGRDHLKRFRKSSGRVKAGVAKLIKGQDAGAIVIDCDADPFVIAGWTVEEHKRDGQFTFDPSQIELYLDDSQKRGSYIVGDKLRQRLADEPVLNANVLDYLLANPNLIPDDWKADKAGNTRYSIFFWGTVYNPLRYGSLCVRYLHWNGIMWDWGFNLLSWDWCGDYPAAVLAS
jgi:hypothetical protein